MALGSDSRTRSINVKWIVEVYTFPSSVPKAGEFSKAMPPAAVVSGKSGISSVNKFIEESKKSGIFADDLFVPEKAFGLTSIRIDRNKIEPDAKCSFTFVGPLPKSIYAGSWVVITSATRNSSGSEKRLVKFVGQIVSSDSSYTVMSNGLLSVSHRINLEEWSRILRAPVRYDIFSIQQSVLNAGLAGQLSIAQNLLNSNETDDSYQQILNMVNKSYDPFELAHLVLRLIGMMNKQDVLDKIDGDKLKKTAQFPKIALSAPFIPSGVMARLGITSSVSSSVGPVQPKPADPANPFEAGFVRILTGMQPKAVNATGDWDGIWKDPSIDDYKGVLREAFESNKNTRPSAQGIGSILGTGAPAWNILTGMLDPSINEVFTDILYKEGIDENDIVAVPAIFVRDKPFLLKVFKDRSNVFEGWTIYDYLPRVRIPEETIVNFRINNTFLDSPNYFRVDYHGTNHDKKVDRANSIEAGFKRLEPEMNRFGGKHHFIQTRFLGNDFTASASEGASGTKGSFIAGAQNEPLGNSDSTYKLWFEKLKNLSVAWHAFRYRMGSGLLVIKDDNFAISVGMNIQFKFGNYDLVGHVDSLGIAFSMEADGLETTHTQIRLSRIMYDNILTGNLSFIDLEDFGSLHTSSPSHIDNILGSGEDLGDFNIVQSPGTLA